RRRHTRETRRSRVSARRDPGGWTGNPVQLSVRPGHGPVAGDRRRAPPGAASSVTGQRHSRVSSAASVGGDGSLRLFCALTLPAETLDRLEAWQSELRPGRYRLVPRENLHVTLAFLGARPAVEVD